MKYAPRTGDDLSKEKWKRAELIFTGNELLNGNVLNTNSQWIAQTLTSLGIEVKRMEVIEDNIDVISRTIRESLDRRPDFIVVSGGLGPTYDDVTLEGIAKAIGKALEVNQVALKMVSDRYALAQKAGLLKVKESERLILKMSSLPADSTPLTNPVGAAPGVMIQQTDTVLFSVPGVPAEMKAIFDFAIVPWMKSHLGNAFHAQKKMIVVGLGESRLGPIIEGAMRTVGNTWIKSCVQGAGKSEILISTTASSEDTARRRIQEASNMITEKARNLGGQVED
jgi:molybdenum cofactor synthesis domain-containing protein